VSTSLLVLNSAVICYPASMVNWIWLANEKVFIVSALSNMWPWNQATRDPKTQPILQARCASALSCSNMWKFSYPHRHVNAIALDVFCGCNCKNFNNLSSTNQIFYHRSLVVTDSTSWDQQACTRDILWRQRYVTPSKEYLINCHILLQYFELVFLATASKNFV